MLMHEETMFDPYNIEITLIPNDFIQFYLSGYVELFYKQWTTVHYNLSTCAILPIWLCSVVLRTSGDNFIIT